MPIEGEQILKETTVQQYMVYLRRYETTVGSLTKATHAKLRAFVGELTSPWSQRRAVSAFRRFFVRAHSAMKLAGDPSAPLVDGGFSRPNKTTLAELFERLVELGIPPKKIAALTWHDVKLVILSPRHSDLTALVGAGERKKFRAMLLQRFPGASMLASAAHDSVRCFRRLGDEATLRSLRKSGPARSRGDHRD